MPKQGEILACSCCGDPVRNNKKENADYGKVPYPQDEGFGTCKDCGGDDSVKFEPGKEPTEAQTRKKLGWAMCTFCDARIPLVRDKMNDDQKAIFDKFPYWKKCSFIARLVEKGAMI